MYSTRSRFVLAQSRQSERIWLIALAFVVAGVIQAGVVAWLLYIGLLSVRADSFYPSGDILKCDFVPALAWGIKNLPEDSIDFNNSLVSGASESNLQSAYVLDLVNVRIGQVKRYSRYTNVSVPPESEVLFYLYGYNFSGHKIKMDRIYVSASEGSRKLSDFLDLHTAKKELSILYSGVFKRVNKDFLVLNNGYVCPAGSAYNPAMCKFKLPSFGVKKPVEVSVVQDDCSINKNGQMQHSVYVCVYNKFGAESESVSVTTRDGINLSFSIKRNAKKCFNIQTEDNFINILRQKSDSICLTKLGTRGDNVDMYTRAVFVNRGDYGAPSTWFRIQPGFSGVGQEGKRFFCLTRIPYTEKITIRSCSAYKKVELHMDPDMSKILAGNNFNVKLYLRNLGVNLTSVKINLNLPQEWENYLQVFINESWVNINDINSIVLDSVKYGATVVKDLRFRFIKNIPNNMTSVPFRIGASVQDFNYAQDAVQVVFVPQVKPVLNISGMCLGKHQVIAVVDFKFNYNIDLKKLVFFVNNNADSDLSSLFENSAVGSNFVSWNKNLVLPAGSVHIFKFCWGSQLENCISQQFALSCSNNKIKDISDLDIVVPVKSDSTHLLAEYKQSASVLGKYQMAGESSRVNIDSGVGGLVGDISIFRVREILTKRVDLKRGVNGDFSLVWLGIKEDTMGASKQNRGSRAFFVVRLFLWILIGITLFLGVFAFLG